MLLMARKPEPPPRPSRITVPEVCHPAVKVVFAEMKRQGITYDELEYKSGVLKSTFKAWRTNNRPGLETVEAALGALGWSFLPVPCVERLPVNVKLELERISKEWGEVDKLIVGLVGAVAKSAALEARSFSLAAQSERGQLSTSCNADEARKAKISAYSRQAYAKKKANETQEDREIRRAKARQSYEIGKKRRAENETPTEYAARKARAREYQRAYYRSRNPRHNEEVHVS